MLPLDRKTRARRFAGAVIVATLIAAVWVPLVLYQHKALDGPIVVAILLLLLAILPPEFATLDWHPHRTVPHHKGT